jgi:hypothetical protein
MNDTGFASPNAVRTSDNTNLIDNDDDDDARLWRSCCFIINKNFLKYIIQVFISCVILSLCSYKIIIIDESEDKSIYISLITLVTGVFLPSPSPH